MSRCDCPPSLRSVGSAHERGRAAALAAPDGAGSTWAPGAERPQGRPAAAHFCAPDGADAPEDREKPLQIPPRPVFALGPDYLCASVSRTPFAEPRYIATPARAETLAQLVSRWLPDPVLRAHAVARVDGREIPARAWDRFTPLAGSLVEIAVRPGQRGKNPLATILQIALLAGALAISGGALGGLLGTSSLFAAGSISAGLAAAAFTVAGSYLINAIAPPPDLGLNRAGGEVSPTYFINAARNQLRLGAPVPAIHGRHRMVPPLGGSYVREVRGDDLWLRGIVVWGIGPVEISDVRIGDTPFDQFAGTTIQHYPGDGTATPLSLYPNAPTELDVGATLSNAAGWIRRTTNANAEEISVDVDFPQGLARVNPKNGRLEARSVQLEVRWAPADASGEPAAAWQYSAPTPGQADAAAASQGGVRVGSGLFNFDYNEWQLALTATPTQWIHTRSERKPFRRSRRWAVARQPHGYVVEVRRVTPDTPDNDLEVVDTCVWSILRSVFMRAPVRDPWIAYSAFEIRASDQLNSVVDELNAVVERLYPDFDADGLKGSYGENGGLVGDWVKSRLPAHAVVDAMTGKGRQRPFGSDQMDFVFFDGWRQWCADNDRFFDHVVDYETTASRFIRTAMAAGQAGPRWRGAQLSGVIDAPRPVRRMLTARSMRRFSATLTFPGEIHGLSTEFLNEEQGWQLDDATVYVPGFGPATATRIERMPSPGKTRPEEVQEWLAFHLASMLLQSRERYEIETDLPAFAVQRGERQLVSHDVVRSGTGARVIDVETDSAGDVTAVLLDEEIDIVAGTDYGMRWREPVPDPGSAEPGQMVWSIRDTAPVTAAAGRTARMVFVSPRPPQDAPFEGDEVVVGERFAEAEDVVVLGVLRGDDRASTLLAVPYGETRFSGDIVIPEFATSVQNPFKARPPRPRPAGAPYASDDGIAVPFTIETGATVPVARFIARWRRTPDGSETDGGFDALPNLASDERRVILPAGDPAQPYDLDLWAEDYDGRRSEPMELRALLASEFVPAPDLLDAEGGHDETEGAKLPALTVRWDPYTNPEIANLRIAIRNPGQGVDDFEEVATADPDAGEKTTRDVPRGRTVEVGARFRSRRGGFSQWAVWPEPVEIPAELVASEAIDALALQGLTREEIEGFVTTLTGDIQFVIDYVGDIEDIFQQGVTEVQRSVLRASSAAQSGDNMLPNGSFGSGDLWTWSTSGGGVSVLDRSNPPASPPGNLEFAPSRHVLQILASTSQRLAQIPAEVVQCQPGDVFSATCWYALNGPAPAPTMALYVQFRTADGTFISPNQGGTFTASWGGWNKRTVENVVAPANAAWACIAWVRSGTTGGALVLATDFRLTRTDPGTLAARATATAASTTAVGASENAENWAAAAGEALGLAIEVRNDTEGLFTATVDVANLAQGAANSAGNAAVVAQTASRQAVGQSRRYTADLGLDAMSSSTSGIEGGDLGSNWSINQNLGNNYGSVFQTSVTGVDRFIGPKRAIRTEVGKRYRVIFTARFNGADTGGSSGQAPLGLYVRQLDGNGAHTTGGQNFKTMYLPVQNGTYTTETVVEGSASFPYIRPFIQVRAAWGARSGALWVRWIIVEEDTTTVAEHRRALVDESGRIAEVRTATDAGGGSETIFFMRSRNLADGTVDSEVGIGGRLISLWNNVANQWERVLAVFNGNVHITNKLFLGNSIELDPAEPRITIYYEDGTPSIELGELD